MPKSMSPELQALIARPNFAHLATIQEDGAPKLDPIWIDVVDEQTLVMATGRTSLKTRNILRDLSKRYPPLKEVISSIKQN